MDEIFYGYIPSILDGTERQVDEKDPESLPLPIKYSYLDYMSPVLNQGAESTCVPSSISAAYDYYNAMVHPETAIDGKFVNKGISIHQIYNCRSNAGEGMSYKEALEFCKIHGVVSEKAYIRKQMENPSKIYDYARVGSMLAIKQCLVLNGPVMIATLVKNLKSSAFWRGVQNYGGHATCLIGYDDSKRAFLLRNSWGKDFGENGYTWFPYQDFKDILEAWTIVI